MTPAAILKAILSRGYFPAELPPPFTTESFAAFVDVYTGKNWPFDTSKRKSSKPLPFNLARAGSLRRELSIPNPVHYAQLAKAIANNWSFLEEKLRSRFSLTTPKLETSGRALARLHELEDLPEILASVRAKGRVVLHADIARFYPSIYTHSIPWVLHGKKVAKARRHDKTLIGNIIDELVRRCQDDQTMGIPVGPDSSLVVAELVLAFIDKTLSKQKLTGVRYVDDYEIIFQSEEAALKGRSTLQEALLEVELNLGPSKTAIQRLPLPLREPWLAELKKFRFKTWRAKYRHFLIRFFEKAFDLSVKYPGQGVLKYAAAKIAKLNLRNAEEIRLAENLLIQCGTVEAGALAYVLAALLRHPTKDPERTKKRKGFLIDMIHAHAPQRHSSEVAWALWAFITLKYQLSSSTVRVVVEMNDPICALLVLHAREEKLVGVPSLANVLRDDLDQDALYGPKWLLAYEAVRKGWLKFPGKQNFVKADDNFSQLSKAGVSFYDKQLTILPAAKAQDPFSGEREEDIIDGYIYDIVREYDDDGDDDEDEDEEDEENED